MAGMGSGPVAWWETRAGSNPGGGGPALTGLKAAAPDGYEYDPVTMGYRRTPTSAGQRTADYNSAATGGAIPGSLQALLKGAGGGGAMDGGIMTAAGGGGTGTGTGGTGNIAHVAAPDMSQSNASTFAAAKDRAGQIARSSLDALNGELGSQGLLGSGAQVQGARDIISKGQGEVGAVNRDNAVNDANQKADFAKMGYQGDITQRGQNIQHEEANAQLASANQDRYMRMLQLLMQSVSGPSASLIY